MGGFETFALKPGDSELGWTVSFRECSKWVMNHLPDTPLNLAKNEPPACKKHGEHRLLMLQKILLPSLKLTVRTWKLVVGRWISFWGPAYFEGRLLLVFRGVFFGTFFHGQVQHLPKRDDLKPVTQITGGGCSTQCSGLGYHYFGTI